MDKQSLIALLKRIADENGGDQEASHSEADKALIEFINDPEITAAWEDAEQFFWYA